MSAWLYCPVARSAAADERRLDPAVIQLDNPGGTNDAMVVSYNLMFGLCGDGDGCRLRLTVDSELEPGVASRWFIIRASGAWRATTGEGAVVASGDLSDTTNELVIQFGNAAFTHLCRLEDDSKFDGTGIVRRFRLEANTVEFQPFSCLLRIED